MIKIIQRRKIWFSISSILMIAGIVAIATWGLKLGIDFSGGTLLEVGFNEGDLTSEEIKTSLQDLGLGEINVQFSSEGTALIRMKDMDEETHQKVLAALESGIDAKLNPDDGVMEETENVGEGEAETVEVSPGISVTGENAEDVSVEILENNTDEVTLESVGSEDSEVITSVGADYKYVAEKRFDSIGPVIGDELKRSTAWALAIALCAIALYIAWAFRKVSYPISSFKYGIAAIVALFHDIIITIGVFAVLGHFYGVEVGISFVAALLAILGYSINDTIVVFDRTRENLIKTRLNDFEETVNKSVNETLVRSLNTSFTTLLTLFALYIFGGSSISYFVLALIIGIAAGTYSSIFVASPLLVTWQKFDARKK